MPTFTAVITCHDGDPTKILGNLRYQTRRPDQTLLYWSWADPKLYAFVREHFPEAKVFTPDNLNDWGHQKRAVGLLAAHCDYVGFFNHDDAYSVEYVEKMLAAAERERADVVYCDWNGRIDTEFTIGNSTSGNFIVRTPLAQGVGWNHRQYDADGLFISDLRATRPRIAKVPLSLYTHNPE